MRYCRAQLGQVLEMWYCRASSATDDLLLYREDRSTVAAGRRGFAFTRARAIFAL